MAIFQSGDHGIHIDEHLPAAAGKHPALVLLHGAGGNVSFWLDRLAPQLTRAGVGIFAPHYFEKTGTGRATPEIILDGRHVPAWLGAVQDAIAHVARQPAVDPARIGVLGISLGGYLSVALAALSPSQHTRLRAVVELSGGLPPGFDHLLSPATPPILVLHGDADTVVPVSQAHTLDRMLTQRGVPHRMEIFPGEGHWFSPVAQLRLLGTCASFLREHL